MFDKFFNETPRAKQRGIFLHAKIYFVAPKVGAMGKPRGI